MEAKIAAAKVQTGLHNVSDTELVEIYAALKGNDEYKVQFNKLMYQSGTRLKKILDEDKQAQDQSRGGAATVTTTDEQIILRNLNQLENYDSINPLDESNKEFADSRKYLQNMIVVDEQGNKIDLSSNVVEVAKLKTIADLSILAEPITPELYKAQLRDNMDMSIYGIMMTNLSSQGNASSYELKQPMREMLDGKTQTVTAANASGVLASQIVSLNTFADNLNNQTHNASLAQKFKARVIEANTSLTQKLKETYIKARTYAQILQEQGVWADVGMAFVAGFGGPAGMAAYGAWTYYRRVHPLYKAYREEKKNNPEMKSFWKYLGKHKKDTMFAGLYMASSVASFAVAGVAVSQAMAHGTSLAQVGTASVAPLVQAKAGIALATVATRCTTDIAQAWGTPDMDKAVKRSLFSLGLYGVGYASAQYLANALHNSSAEAPTNTAETPTHNPETQVTHNTDSVSQTPTHPVEKGDSIFKPLPWQDYATETQSTDTTAVEKPALDNSTVTETVNTSNTEYTVGAREQAVYERNLKIVDKSVVMVANVKDGTVELPKGMTPEMAVNLARVEMLYYGDDTGLKVLLDCEEVSKISSTSYFNNLASKFTDSCSDPHGVGFPKDPNYGYADPNIYTRSIEVDCEKTILHGGRTVTSEQPIETKIPTPQENINPDKQPVAPTPDTPTQTPTEVENLTHPANNTPLEPPHLEGKGGNTPLNNNINEEAVRIGARELGADGEGNIVRVDTEQNYAQPETPKGKVPTSGKGSESLSQALIGRRINTFDL